VSDLPPPPGSNPQQPPPPGSQPPAPPGGQPPPGAWQQPEPAAPKQGAGCLKIGLIVLAVFVVLGIVGVGCLAVAGNEVADEIDKSLTTEPGKTVTDDPSSGSSTTDAEKPSKEPVVVTGFTKYEALGETWVSVGIVLTDLSGGSQELTVSLLDAEGNPLATSTDYVGSDRDGGEVLAAVNFLDDTPTVASVRVDITNASSFTDAAPFGVEVAGQEFDGNFWSIKGTATNDGSENVNLGTITCVGFKGGKPVAGAKTSTDTMVPGAKVAWEAQNTFDPQADEVRCQGESL
jgi:hypothetical protein